MPRELARIMIAFIALAPRLCALHIAVVMAAGLCAGASAHQVEGAVDPPDDIDGSFSLIDDSGHAVTNADYPDKYLLVYFGYTHCADTCPLGLFVLSTAVNSLGALGERIQPLFITVDPRRDTVETLGPYVKAFHPRLRGLTGSVAQIDAATRHFDVDHIVAQINGEYLVYHTSFTYLLGPDGRLLGVYATGITAKDMAHAIKEAIEGEQHS